jgi:hypothetical protein
MRKTNGHPSNNSVLVIEGGSVTLPSMSNNTGRFLAVNLTEAEWQALRGVTPDPCAWIKSQIHKLLEESGVRPTLEEQDSLFAVSLAD